MKFKKMLSLLIVATLLVSTTSCKFNKSKNKDTNTLAYDFSDSTLEINRPKRSETSPMGEKGTWTIFVYLCGSDLESRNGGGMASMDMQEMIDSSANNKVKYVVETGGAANWKNDVSASAIQRYEICNGKAQLVDSQPNANMGDGNTLADFLDWGINNYPAANMGLVLWDHGGGSISGICFDEQAGYDSLYLKELDAALYSVYDKMTEPFEFIGFDACLMSTIETAAILSTHANYMISSEESEPGYGWDYTAIGNYLAKNPTANGDEVGKIVCDSFYEACEKIHQDNNATLSVTDLSKIDTVLLGFDIYAKDIYNITDDPASFIRLARNILSVDNFGGNNRSEGYTNMIDLGGLVAAGSDFSDTSESLQSAISDIIVYQVRGSNHNQASGLSIYFPLCIKSSQELSIFKDICTSQYYLGLVDKIAYGAINSSIANYNNSSVLSLFSNDWSLGSYLNSNGNYSYNYQPQSTWDYINGFSPDGNSTAIAFSHTPELNNGNYTFTLTDNALLNTDYVSAYVYIYLEDTNSIFELGNSGDVNSDYDTGVFSDNFNGKWFSLLDGQLLSAYLVEKYDNCDIYTSPIMLNGVKTNLRFKYDYDKNSAEIIDIWDGVNEYSASSRGENLSNGDSIKPIYYIRSTTTNLKGDYVSKTTYKYKGDNKLILSTMPKGEYWYSFHINDVFGNYYETDPVCFNMSGQNEQVNFENETHKWSEATCTQPKTCLFCGATEGNAAGHKWENATCTKPKTCSECGETEGEAAGHKWIEATFSEPETCTVCGETRGDLLNYTIGNEYSDYTLQDMDDDGQNELVEIYNGYYRIYENENDYYDLELPVGGISNPVEYIVYDGNIGKTCVYYTWDGYEFGDGYMLGDVVTGNMVLKEYYDIPSDVVYDYGDYSSIEKYRKYYKNASYTSDWKITGTSITESQFNNYLNNITLLYSYSDPQGGYLK